MLNLKMYKFEKLCAFVILLLNIIVSINSFNLDTQDYVLYRGDNDSMFGFSVAAHQDREYNWVLIGAPQAQSSQPGVSRGGAVYFCPADRDDGCRELPFDRSGNYNNQSGHQIDEKSGQWFGATVNSGGPDKPIVACAPRYLWYTLKSGRRDPVGTCYVSSSDFREFSEFSPCRTRHWGYHRQGTCQAGLGAAISKAGDRLFIGAPGSWYWQGQMYSIDPEAKLPFAPPRYSNYGTSAGQLYSQHLKKRPAVFFTKEGQPWDDDSYLGYSVTAGNFTGEKDGGIAAGMPRGNRLVGKVVLYTWNLTNYQNISGSQLGAYFGYAVAAADVNGDGLDDLIVGAPLHTESNNEGKYEVGRIYVVYSVRSQDDLDASSDAKLPRLRNFDRIDGVNSKGRFGLSVASLGDLDLDGYQDIAVGAPYDGPLGRGAVYIYYGSKKGIRTKVSQIIYSEDVSQTAMYTFGFSIAGSGIDLDRNQYPDLVVGAYLSSTAFVFRSQPVINVEATVQFNTHNNVIGLEEKNCTISQGKSVSCTSFNACVTYNGIGVSNGISLIMEFTLDSKKPKDPRMFLYPSERRHKFNETWTLRRNDRQCKTMQVYIKDNTRDKLTPLEVEMRYSLYGERKSGALLHQRNPRSSLHPVLNGNLPSVFKDSIVIRKNCGNDDVCIPDLRLYVTPNVGKYLLGSNKRLKIDVIVKNEGEDSFESMFYMKMPPGINYFNTENKNGSLNIPVKCSAPSESTDNTLKCDIGNPLPKDKLVHFTVLLDPFNIDGMNPSYDFSMKVNSTNPENNASVSDNVKSLSIDIWVKTNLSLTGWALSPDIHYKENQYKEYNFTSESEIGPQIVHIYSLKNNGPSDIKEAEVLFMWPSATLGGDDLLYIMEQPETSGSIKCEYVREANSLGVELSPKKYYLESNSKLNTGKVSIEEKSVTNVVSSLSGSHDRKDETDDKLDETGDASHVHVHRGKERTYGEGVTTSTKLDSTITSKTDQKNWGRNISTSTANNRFKDFTGTTSVTNNNNNQDISNTQKNINKYKIYYTSTATQQANRFGDNNEQEGSFSVSGQSNLGHYNFNDSGKHDAYYNSRHELSPQQPNYESKKHGYQVDNTGSTQYGIIRHNTQHQSQPTTVEQSSYFNWDNTDTSGLSKGYDHSSINTRQNNNLTDLNRQLHSSGGYISGSGEFVYHQQNSSGTDEEAKLYGSINRGKVNVHSSGSTSHDNSKNWREGGSVYKMFYNMSGQDVRNMISEEDLRKMIESGSGEFRNGTHTIRWSVNHTGNFNAHDDKTGITYPYSISTEESVNEGLDEYTRTVTHGGAYHSSGQRSQTNRQQSGGRHQLDFNRNDQNYNSGSGIGSIAIGSGFRTTAVDIGPLSNANVDETISRHAQQNFNKDNSGINMEHNYESNLYYDPDLGSYEDRSGERASHGSVTYGTSRTYSGERHASLGQGQRRQYNSISSNSGHSEYSGDTNFRDNVYRNKRQVEDDFSKIIQCKSTQCSVIRCKTGRLFQDEEAAAALRFRANPATLKKLGWTQAVEISSMMVARINKLPYIGTPNERPIHTHEIFTNVTLTETEIKPDVVPLWVVVLSACAGAIILLLLISLLYKCGFFKRNRPSDAPERQPLNRNGHYQGDEQL